MLRKIWVGLLAMVFILALPGALAETAALNGTVVNTGEETVLTLYGGTVGDVRVKVGDAVHAGDVIASLNTRKVYALQDGIVRFFGEPGESTAMITEQYGAVAYVEPSLMYTVSVSTKNADTSNEENLHIHPGETVYLRVIDDMMRTGTGLVTTVASGSFTVLVTSGSFKSGSSVYAYRDPAFLYNTRVGKGSVTLADPVAYTDEGIVVAYSVENGANVKKGDVLFELIDGSYAGSVFGGTEILSPADGVISTLSVSRGSSVQAGEAVATVYPDEALRIEALVSETDLHFVSPGQKVTVEFNFLNDGTLSVPGTVESISELGEGSVEGSEEAWFTVSVRSEENKGRYYGAHAVVWTE